MRRAWPSFVQKWFPFTQGRFVPNLVEIGPSDVEKRIFQVICIFSLFSKFSPWQRLCGENVTPFTKGSLVYCEFWRKRFSKLSITRYFHYSIINSLWFEVVPFIWTKNFLHLRMTCANFGWNLFWRRRWLFCEKFTTTTTTMTENGKNKIDEKAHLSLLFRWAKNIFIT